MNIDVRNISVQEGYALWANTYDEEDNALIFIEEHYVNPILKELDYSKVLDVGTGTGRHAISLALGEAEVTAVDQSPTMLEIARREAARAKVTIDFQLATIEDGLSFAADTFDLLTCGLVLCHIPDLHSTIQEFARVLKPGGYMLITDFHPDSIEYGWRTHFKQDGTIYQLPNMNHTVDDYLNAARASGLTILKVLEIPINDKGLSERYFSKELLAERGELGFCLIILAQK
jgi:ubiquinone/menaquinone biosynthesis C-methylase UbiE